MTERRNLQKELSHSVYYDMEDGNDTESICYPSLICIITELCDRIEQLEAQVNKPLDKEVFDWNETGDGV